MIRRLPLLGSIAVAVGFVVIGAAWWAAHGRTYVDQQFPALVAGGVAGLALVILGAAALGIAAHHQATDKLAGHLTELVRNATASVEAEPPPPEASTDAEPARTTSRANGHSNGHAGHDHGNGNGDGQARSPFVVPRRTLFHDPTCRLVTTRDDTEVIARPDAVASGLAACRVCRP